MKYILIVIGILIIAATIFLFTYQNEPDDRVACTLEAKICPDGSAVGRTGPNCEFAACPGEEGVAVDDTTSVDNTPIDTQEYFTKELQAGVIDRVGQPIEGFIPPMFMDAFSGIVPQDFDGADALLGEYKIVEKELIFIVDDVDPIHSAADVLSEEGMETVFNNIKRRANVLITTTDEIDGLLLFLGAPLNLAVIECLPEQRNVDACIEIYQPVCATVNVQCITTPCEPVLETFSNSCQACTNSLVSSYTEGECLVNQ